MPRQRPDYDARLGATVRRLRRDATVPERLLWSRLSRRALGVAFRRQAPVGRYVVDFLAPDARLVIEVDGRSHDGRGDADRARQAALEAAGLRVLRVQNDDVLRDLDGTVRLIAETLAAGRPETGTQP